MLYKYFVVKASRGSNGAVEMPKGSSDVYVTLARDSFAAISAYCKDNKVKNLETAVYIVFQEAPFGETIIQVNDGELYCAIDVAAVEQMTFA